MQLGRNFRHGHRLLSCAGADASHRQNESHSAELGSRLGVRFRITEYRKFIRDGIGDATCGLRAILSKGFLRSAARDINKVSTACFRIGASLVICPSGRVDERVRAAVAAISSQIGADRTRSKSLHRHGPSMRVQLRFGDQRDDLMACAAPAPSWSRQYCREKRGRQKHRTEPRRSCECHAIFLKVVEESTARRDDQARDSAASCCMPTLTCS